LFSFDAVVMRLLQKEIKKIAAFFAATFL